MRFVLNIRPRALYVLAKDTQTRFFRFQNTVPARTIITEEFYSKKAVLRIRDVYPGPGS
jgi:hypothetical protein